MNDGEAWVLAKIVAGLVLVLGFFVHWTLTTEQFEDLLSNYNQSGSRRPASLVKISDLKGGAIITKAMMSTIDLNCVDEDGPLKLKSHTHQLRIVGRICAPPEDQNEPTHQVFISNTSNGFDATVFDRPERRFTTDYIYLKDGTNRIAISTLANGSESMQLVKEVIIDKMDKLVLDGDTSSGTTDSM